MSIDRLSALDQVMLGASRLWPQDICALAILDGRRLLDDTGRLRLEAARAVIGSRLHLAPRFRQVIHTPRRGLGAPLWVDDPTFDLTRHVHDVSIEPPAGEAELLGAAERLRRQPLDPTRPLWQMWFLTGLPEGRVGWFVKTHHAMADGLAAMTILASFLEPDPDAPIAEAPAWTAALVPSDGQLLADNLRRRAAVLTGMLSALAHPRASARAAAAAWPAIRELLAGEPATRTSLDRMVGPDRNLALVRGRLDTVKAIANAHDATVNDVLLAVTAAGLRRLLLRRGESVEDTIVRIYVPVSLRRRLRGPQQGNLVAQTVVPLEMGESDPHRRLRRIAADTAERKAREHTSLGTLFGGRVVRRLLLKATMRQRVNVTSANIPGPKEPLFLAGARILEVFPVLPLIANEPLGIGAVSYAGTFNIGLAADKDAYPDLDAFAASVREELAALGEALEPPTSAPESRLADAS